MTCELLTPDAEPSDMALCHQCREEKFLSEFQRGKNVCRSCTNYQRVAWAHSNPETHARALKIRADYVTRRKEAAGSHTEAQWEALVASYSHRCAYCTRSDRALVKEHVMPLSAGGTNDIWNIVPACQSCNARKMNRLDYKPLLPHEMPLPN